MKKKLILIFLLLISLCLSGCGGSFFGEDETIIIENITKVDSPENDGFYIVIEYANEDKPNDKFFVPNGIQGETGETGNGIKDVDVSIDPITKETTITISFTSEDMEPIIKKIPAGIAIEGVDKEIDPVTGDTKLYIKYTDGTKSDPIIIPKGETGDKGTGIKDYKVEVDPNTKATKIVINFTDTLEPIEINIPAPQKGEEGRGIKGIIAAETNDKYVILVTYTDGQEERCEFSKPSQWITGSNDPEKKEGRNGDYYFDVYHNNIWMKEEGIWILIVDFNDDEQTYTVLFNLNDSLKEKAQMPEGYGKSVTIKRGEYFGVNGNQSLPIPFRVGYRFKGWYLTANPTPINGAFTDTTPVFSDLTLYANWEKIV